MQTMAYLCINRFYDMQTVNRTFLSLHISPESTLTRFTQKKYKSSRIWYQMHAASFQLGLGFFALAFDCDMYCIPSYTLYCVITRIPLVSVYTTACISHRADPQSHVRTYKQRKQNAGHHREFSLITIRTWTGGNKNKRRQRKQRQTDRQGQGKMTKEEKKVKERASLLLLLYLTPSICPGVKNSRKKKDTAILLQKTDTYEVTFQTDLQMAGWIDKTDELVRLETWRSGSKEGQVTSWHQYMCRAGEVCNVVLKRQLAVLVRLNQVFPAFAAY